MPKTTMLINADFSRRAQVTPQQYHWVASPQAGVERVMLDRIGAEKARATSIVRYAAHSFFPAHEHGGGEEILVLSGTFSDAEQDFPAGWYIRNPPGSSHQPFSVTGAVILVKLEQMHADDNQVIRIDTHAPQAWQCSDGRAICPLFTSRAEQVSLQRIAAGTALFSTATHGAELFIITGSLLVDGELLPQGTWLRLPHGEQADVVAGSTGATVYLKTGHLPAAIRWADTMINTSAVNE